MSPFNFGPPPYPLEKFHFLVRETAYELSQHLQAPDALIGMSLLAVMSAACQGRIDVKLPTGQVRPVSLNILAIAESGERKSALDSLTAKPLYDLVERRQDAHELETEQYEHDLAMWEDAAKVLLKKRAVRIRKVMSTEEVTLELTKHRKSKPVPPRMRQLVRHDLSGRAFADALHGDGESLALMSAEGDVLLRSGALKQLGWLNSVWDGSTLTLDRADGKGVVARNPRVTVSIMAQPSAFHRHLARHGEQARGTGLLARFLVGWPTSTQGTRFLSGTEPSWEKLSLFHERVTKLLDEYDASLAAGCNQRMTIAFTEDAKYRWIEFVNHAEQLISPQEDFHHVSDHVSKVSEIIGRLAAILHHFSLQEGDITIDTLERAVAIVTWHADEFRRLFSPTSDVSLSHGDAYDLARHLHEKVWLRRLSGVRRNQLLRSGPVRLRTKRRLEPALDVLIGIGAVSLDRNGNGPCYLDLNPKFFGSFSAF